MYVQTPHNRSSILTQKTVHIWYCQYHNEGERVFHLRVYKSKSTKRMSLKKTKWIFLCVYAYMLTMCMSCPCWLAEGIIFPETGVTSSCELPCITDQNQYARAASALNILSISSGTQRGMYINLDMKKMKAQVENDLPFKTRVLNFCIMTLLRGIYQIFCLTSIYIMTHNRRKISVMT